MKRREFVAYLCAAATWLVTAPQRARAALPSKRYQELRQGWLKAARKAARASKPSSAWTYEEIYQADAYMYDGSMPERFGPARPDTYLLWLGQQFDKITAALDEEIAGGGVELPSLALLLTTSSRRSSRCRPTPSKGCASRPERPPGRSWATSCRRLASRRMSEWRFPSCAI
jgi:hypothetical protein